MMAGAPTRIFRILFSNSFFFRDFTTVSDELFVDYFFNIQNSIIFQREKLGKIPSRHLRASALPSIVVG